MKAGLSFLRHGREEPIDEIRRGAGDIARDVHNSADRFGGRLFLPISAPAVRRAALMIAANPSVLISGTASAFVAPPHATVVLEARKIRDAGNSLLGHLKPVRIRQPKKRPRLKTASEDAAA